MLAQLESSLTLLDILSHSLIWHQLVPYLVPSSILALCGTCKAARDTLQLSVDTFRHLDLSGVASARLSSTLTPLDNGGISWRNERMDESLTEDEFYAGPLRGIFSKLNQRHVLKDVQILVLDGLSVPADLVQEIITEERYNVRILSIRGVKHLNDRKLMQVLRYAVRPTRPDNTPRLKGLYYFTDPRSMTHLHRETGALRSTGVTASEGAQIGATWNQKSHDALTASLPSEDVWYQPFGRVIKRSPSTEWAETLRMCEGIIAFDAVLCRGPRHEIDSDLFKQSENESIKDQWLRPAMATIALGQSGCSKCQSSWEGPPVTGASPSHHLPLISPPPLRSASIRQAQQPVVLAGSPEPRLFVRCEDCLRGRWCERCFKWWDEACYSEPLSSKRLTEIGVGVERDCFDCGRTCADCKELYMRKCNNCGDEFCIVDNEGSSESSCDWCNNGGRRTRELY